MNEIFKNYGTTPEPLLKAWLDEANAAEINDPEAVCLATANTNGHPSARMVLIKSISDKGIKFHTNEESRKGSELAQNPHAAMCIYWKSTRKQIRIEGRVQQVSTAEADDYFATRPIERQIGAWASKQSRPYEKLSDLQDAVDKYRDQFAGTDHIPRPPYWKGFLLVPRSYEFWIGQKDRLHTRFIYTRKENGDNDVSVNTWTAHWLCP